MQQHWNTTTEDEGTETPPRPQCRYSVVADTSKSVMDVVLPIRTGS